MGNNKGTNQILEFQVSTKRHQKSLNWKCQSDFLDPPAQF